MRYKSVSGDLRYFGWGSKPHKLYRNLDYLRGLRGVLERTFMKLPSRGYPMNEQNDEDAAVLNYVETAKAQRGFLLNTSYYKNTWAVGPTVRRDTPNFLKMFKSEQDADEEERRSLIAAELCRKARIACPEIISRTPSAVEYRLIEHVGRASMKDTLRVATQIALAAVADTRDGHVTLEDARTVERLLKSNFASHAAGWRYLLDETCAYSLAHGDITPWNLVKASNGELQLIDFETIAYRPVGYDLIHPTAQHYALQGQAIPIKEIRSRIGQAFRVSHDEATSVLRNALRVELVETALSFERYPANRKRLRQMVLIKLDALHAVST